MAQRNIAGLPLPAPLAGPRKDNMTSIWTSPLKVHKFDDRLQSLATHFAGLLALEKQAA
jgi:hypothetical protein